MFCKAPYGGFARLHSRLCLYVYHRIGIIIGPRYQPTFDAILANTPWKAFWNRFMAEEQDKIWREQCKPGGVAETMDGMNKDATCAALAKAKWDWQLVLLEVKAGLQSDKPGHIKRKPKCIEIKDSLPRPSRAITAKSMTPAKAVPKVPSKVLKPPPSLPELEDELGTVERTVADDFVERTLGLTESATEMDQSSYETPGNVRLVPALDLQQLESPRNNNPLRGGHLLSLYLSGGDANVEMLQGDIGSHEPNKDEEDTLLQDLKMAAESASSVRAVEYTDQSKAPGSNGPALGRP